MALGDDIGILIKQVAELKAQVRALGQVVAQSLPKRPTFHAQQVGQNNPVTTANYTVYLSGTNLHLATWDSSTNELTEGVGWAYLPMVNLAGKLVPNLALGLFQYAIRMTHVFTISASTVRVAEVLNGKIIAVDCEELQLA